MSSIINDLKHKKEQVTNIILKAQNFDTNELQKDAYEHYLKCVILISNQLLELNSKEINENVRQYISSIINLVEHCCKRIRHLSNSLGHILEKKNTISQISKNNTINSIFLNKTFGEENIKESKETCESKEDKENIDDEDDGKALEEQEGQEEKEEVEEEPNSEPEVKEEPNEQEEQKTVKDEQEEELEIREEPEEELEVKEEQEKQEEVKEEEEEDDDFYSDFSEIDYNEIENINILDNKENEQESVHNGKTDSMLDDDNVNMNHENESSILSNDNKQKNENYSEDKVFKSNTISNSCSNPLENEKLPPFLSIASLKKSNYTVIGNNNNNKFSNVINQNYNQTNNSQLKHSKTSATSNMHFINNNNNMNPINRMTTTKSTNSSINSSSSSNSQYSSYNGSINNYNDLNLDSPTTNFNNNSQVTYAMPNITNINRNDTYAMPNINRNDTYIMPNVNHNDTYNTYCAPSNLQRNNTSATYAMTSNIQRNNTSATYSMPSTINVQRNKTTAATYRMPSNPNTTFTNIPTVNPSKTISYTNNYKSNSAPNSATTSITSPNYMPNSPPFNNNNYSSSNYDSPNSPTFNGNISNYMPNSPTFNGSMPTSNFMPNSPKFNGNNSYMLPNSPQLNGSNSYMAPNSPQLNGSNSYMAPNSPQLNGRNTFVTPNSPQLNGNVNNFSPSSPQFQGNAINNMPYQNNNSINKNNSIPYLDLNSTPINRYNQNNQPNMNMNMNMNNNIPLMSIPKPISENTQTNMRMPMPNPNRLSVAIPMPMPFSGPVINSYEIPMPSYTSSPLIIQAQQRNCQIWNNYQQIQNNGIPVSSTLTLSLLRLMTENLSIARENSLTITEKLLNEKREQEMEEEEMKILQNLKLDHDLRDDSQEIEKKESRILSTEVISHDTKENEQKESLTKPMKLTEEEEVELNQSDSKTKLDELDKEPQELINEEMGEAEELEETKVIPISDVACEEKKEEEEGVHDLETQSEVTKPEVTCEEEEIKSEKLKNKQKVEEESIVKQNKRPSKLSKIVKKPVDKENKKLFMINNLIMELYNTECTFIESLEIMISCIKKKLLEKNLIPKNAVEVIFFGIEEILSFSLILREEFKLAIDNSNTDKLNAIGNVFLKHFGNFDCYVNFVSNYSKSTITMKTYERSKEEFAQFIKNVYKMEECKRQDMNSFFILPIQHATRYSLLLSALYKQNTEDECIETAMKFMKEMAKTLDQVQRQEEEINGFYNVCNETLNCPRALLKNSDIPKRLIKTYSATSWKKIQVNVHVLNDSILITKCRKGNNRYKQKFRYYIEYSSLHIKKNRHSSTDLAIYIKNKSTNNILTKNGNILTKTSYKLNNMYHPKKANEEFVCILKFANEKLSGELLSFVKELTEKYFSVYENKLKSEMNDESNSLKSSKLSVDDSYDENCHSISELEEGDSSINLSVINEESKASIDEKSIN